MKRHLTATLALGALGATGLTGCGIGGEPADASSSSATVQLVTDPSGFDPIASKGAQDYTFSRLLYTNLVVPGADGAVVPALATDWKSPSPAEYIFSMRKGATCGDGSALTPTVAAASLQRFAEAETAPMRTSAFGPGTATFTPDDSAGTLTIKLSVAWADLLPGMALSQAGIVCSAGIKDPEGLARGSVKGAFSGAYTLEDAKPGVKYQLEHRADFEQPDYPQALSGSFPDRLDIIPIDSSSTAANKLQSGGLDVASIFDENADRFADDKDFTTDTYASGAVYLGFNGRPGARLGEDVNLRRAVAQAIDRTALAKAANAEESGPLTSIALPQHPCVVTDPELIPAYDLPAATKSLKGVTIRMLGSVALGRINEYAAESLREAGATVELRSLDNAQFIESLYGTGKDWDVVVNGSTDKTGTMTPILTTVVSAKNDLGVDNPQGAKALNAAMAATGEAKCRNLEATQTSALERVDVVPLIPMMGSIIHSDRVGGVLQGNTVDFSTLRLLKR